METIVVVWYVLNLTDSPLLVGLTAAARLGFNFLALFAGATADLVPRRTLMIIIQAILASLALVMLVLIVSGLIEVWHIFIITLGGGLARIFQMPTAQSLAVDSVSTDRIPNAVALINAASNIALVAGPILGGLLFDLFGPEGAYVLVASLYIASGLATMLMGVIRMSETQKGESVFTLVGQGLRYVKGEQLLWSALLVAVIFNITGFSFHTTLVPIFARDILDRDSVGLGILISSFGIGGLVGSMFWASIPNLKHTGLFCILAVMGWHSTMILFAVSTNFYLSVGILVVTGDDVLIESGVGAHGVDEDRTPRVPGPADGPEDPRDLRPRIRQPGRRGSGWGAWRSGLGGAVRGVRHRHDGHPCPDCPQTPPVLGGWN